MDEPERRSRSEAAQDRKGDQMVAAGRAGARPPRGPGDEADELGEGFLEIERIDRASPQSATRIRS